VINRFAWPKIHKQNKFLKTQFNNKQIPFYQKALFSGSSIPETGNRIGKAPEA